MEILLIPRMLTLSNIVKKSAKRNIDANILFSANQITHANYFIQTIILVNQLGDLPVHIFKNVSH